MTSDGKIDVYCVSIENPQVDGLRDVLGNYLQDGKDHVFKGKMMRVRTDDKTCWRLSAIAWDKENNQFIIQGILNRVNEKDKKSFTLEVLNPYQP